MRTPKYPIQSCEENFENAKFVVIPLPIVENANTEPDSFMIKVLKPYPTSGQRLSLLRALCGKTRKEISNLYHVPEISVRQLERDKYRLTEKTAQRLHQIYGQEGIFVPVSWLIEGRF